MEFTPTNQVGTTLPESVWPVAPSVKTDTGPVNVTEPPSYVHEPTIATAIQPENKFVEMPEIKVTPTPENELLDVLKPVYNKVAALSAQRLQDNPALADNPDDLQKRYGRVTSFYDSWQSQIEDRKREEAEAKAKAEERIKVLVSQLESKLDTVDDTAPILAEIENIAQKYRIDLTALLLKHAKTKVTSTPSVIL
jgi:hypothetical protein